MEAILQSTLKCRLIEQPRAGKVTKMQISNMGGVSPFNTNLQPNTAKTLQNIPLPKFVGYWGGRIHPNHILTKTEATRSDEEIMKDMTELAERFVQQNKFKGTIPGQLPKSLQEEYNKLMGEFIAPYSPDRKAIFTEGFKSTQNEIKNRMSRPMLDTSLITVLFGKNKVNASIWFAPHDKRVIEIDNMSFHNENGEHVGGYNNGRWTISLTEAERQRSNFIQGVFADATNVAALSNNMSFQGGNEEYHAVLRTRFHAQIQAHQAAQTTTQTTTAQQAVSRYEQMQNAERKG